MSQQYHIHLKEGDCAPYVLLPGDPGRVEAVAKTWDEYRLVACNREYVTCTGTYKNAPITCTSTGIGAASTAIALEELARVGARTFLRIGTCGAFQEEVKNGDMLIFDSAARYEGASRAYAPLEFPAVADHRVLSACIQAAENLGISYHVGATRTHDGLYARQPQPGSSFNGFWQSDWAHHFRDLQCLNILGSDMETSIIFVLARIWGLRAGSMAVSVVNLLEEKEDVPQEYDPSRDFERSEDHVTHLALLGNEALRILFERDQAAM